MGTMGVKEANDTIMEGAQCLNALLKKEKKRAKNEKLRFAKNTFLF